MATFIDENEEQISTRLTVQSAVLKLPTTQRVIIAMITAGFTQKECSIISGIPRTVVGQLLRDAKERLKKDLEEVLSDGSP